MMYQYVNVIINKYIFFGLINDVTYFLLQQFVFLNAKIMEFVLHQVSVIVLKITMVVAVKMRKRYYSLILNGINVHVHVHKLNFFHSFALKLLQCQRIPNEVALQRKFLKKIINKISFIN